jgi:hypothetical protein
MSKHKTRPPGQARRIRLAVGDLWTPEVEAAWAPLAGETDLSPRDFVEALVSNLMKKGRAFDSIIEGLTDGTLLEVLTTEIERRTKS